MTNRNAFFAVIAVIAFQILFTVNVYSQPSPITAKELIETTVLKAHVKELEDGDIVMLKGSEKEGKSELHVAMAILVPAPLDKTVDMLQRQSTAEDGPGILAIGEIKALSPAELDKSFAKVTFTDTEKGEVKQLMSIQPGSDFNFSRDEIAMIKKRSEAVQDGAQEGAPAIKAMSGAMREVLKGRFLSYRKGGLNGLAPYQFGPSKQVDPSSELVTATESMPTLKKRYPAYYGCLRYYPEKNDPRCVHQFFWAKQTEADRPLFILKHWVLDIQPDYALITERRFYLSHSLSSLQVVIGCLRHGDGTLVVLLNQTFTEKVNMAIGGTIAKAIGYKEVEKNIRPIFENLKTSLGTD